MLATSVLDELSVPACTALCGPGSAKMLELLYGTHMFVTIVDDQARTYRYHHLIREVLQNELRARYPAREKQLHEAAARYLIEAGQTGAAARHLLAAGERAAAVSLLNEGVVRDVLTNPAVSSALDLDEIRPSCSRTHLSSWCRWRLSCFGGGHSSEVRALSRSPGSAVSTRVGNRSWP